MNDSQTLRRALAMIERWLGESTAADAPVVDYVPARALRERLDLSLGEAGVALDDLLPLVESYLGHSVRTAHAQFMNQLYGGFDPAGFVADMLASATNTSMYTFEVAPVATLMELELIDKMNGLVGFPNGEGIFCTGGSNANLLGVLCARNRAFPGIAARGFDGEARPAIFVSDQAHYSFFKAANVLGLGRDNAVVVPTDDRGRMRAGALEAGIRESRERGARPIFVGATAGTTVLGAFDPLEEIAAVCREHGVWMHVDGAWGGPLLLSDRRRHLLAGAELADSFTWDAHKLMGVTLTCTAFLSRNRGVLLETCDASEHTEYLFHDSDDSAMDLGRMSLQCGRRADSARLWLLWKHHGDRGFAERIEHLFALARVATDEVDRRPRLELLAPTQSLNVCFRYVPARGVEPSRFNLELRERLRHSGKSFINYSRLRGDVALRLVLTNPELTESDVRRLFANVVACAEELSAVGT